MNYTEVLLQSDALPTELKPLHWDKISSCYTQIHYSSLPNRNVISSSIVGDTIADLQLDEMSNVV